MNRWILAMGLAMSAWGAHADAIKILDCNTSFGPDQGVAVRQDGERLYLIETTRGGAIEVRALTPAEWNSRRIRLRDEDGFKAVLTIDSDGNGYLTVTDGSSYHESGPADCVKP